MSMISSLIDKLRQMADGQVTYRDARVVMLEAADTIWELRDDLQRANEAVRDTEHDESMAWDRVRKAEAENAKLRELVADYFNAPCVECNPWDEGWKGCKHCDSGNCNLAVRALKLGVEVEQ